MSSRNRNAVLAALAASFGRRGSRVVLLDRDAESAQAVGVELSASGIDALMIGLRAFGEIYGYSFAAVTLGAAVGPLVMGVSFDTTGSYSLALISFVVVTFTAAGLTMSLGPYRVWEPTAEPVVAAISEASPITMSK